MAFFIGIIPEGIQENGELIRLFSKFKRTLSDRDKEVRWVHPDLWHITLQYLGPLNEEQKGKTIAALENLEAPESIKDLTLRIQGVGAFPEPDHARVLWLGVQKSQPLLDAKESMQILARNLELDVEDKDYVPHLTLARFRNFLSASDLIQLGGRKHFGDYRVSEIVLIESVIQGHTAKYIPVFRKRLNA